MARYEYQCRACRHRFERVEPMARHRRNARPTCPSCGSRRTEQIMSRFFADTRSKT